MKIELVFYKWKGRRLVEVSGGKRINLEMGDFHAGSTFKAEVGLTCSQEEELKKAMVKGYKPIFMVELSEGVKK